MKANRILQSISWSCMVPNQIRIGFSIGLSQFLLRVRA